MGKLKYKLSEKIDFIDPQPEATAGDRDSQGKPKGWAEGIIYVDDERIPKEFLEKIQKRDCIFLLGMNFLICTACILIAVELGGFQW